MLSCSVIFYFELCCAILPNKPLGLVLFAKNLSGLIYVNAISSGIVTNIA